MPTIDLTDNEYAAVTAAIRRAIEDDRFPLAPRLNPLRAALAKFDAEPKLTPEPPLPKTPPVPEATTGRGESQIDPPRTAVWRGPTAAAQTPATWTATPCGGNAQACDPNSECKRCADHTFFSAGGWAIVGAYGGSDTCRFQSVMMCRRSRDRRSGLRSSRARDGGAPGWLSRRRRSSRRAWRMARRSAKSRVATV